MQTYNNNVSFLFDLSGFYQEAGIGFMGFLRQRKISTSFILSEAMALVAKYQNRILTREDITRILATCTNISRTNWMASNATKHNIPALTNESEAHEIYCVIVEIMYRRVALTSRAFLYPYISQTIQEYIITIVQEQYLGNMYLVTYHFDFLPF